MKSALNMQIPGPQDRNSDSVHVWRGPIMCILNKSPGRQVVTLITL